MEQSHWISSETKNNLSCTQRGQILQSIHPELIPSGCSLKYHSIKRQGIKYTFSQTLQMPADEEMPLGISLKSYNWKTNRTGFLFKLLSPYKFASSSFFSLNLETVPSSAVIWRSLLTLQQGNGDNITASLFQHILHFFSILTRKPFYPEP